MKKSLMFLLTVLVLMTSAFAISGQSIRGKITTESMVWVNGYSPQDLLISQSNINLYITEEQTQGSIVLVFKNGNKQDRTVLSWDAQDQVLGIYNNDYYKAVVIDGHKQLGKDKTDARIYVVYYKYNNYVSIWSEGIEVYTPVKVI